MNIKIDTNSSIPIYKQIVLAIRRGTANGSITNGEKLPSLNQFAKQMGISNATTKNAYNLLKKEGLISGKHGKGYFIDIKDSNAPKKVVLFLDNLSSYKQRIYKGASSELEGIAEITIKLFNLDIEVLEKMIDEALGEYDWYMITPHFSQNTDLKRVIRCLKKIPYDKFIILDRDIPSLPGKFGRIYQDFSSDAGNALLKGKSIFAKYSHVEIIASESSLYSREIIPSITKVLDKEPISVNVSYFFKPEMMKPGVVFIVIDGLLNYHHFNILREISNKGLSLGKDIGLISYNDEPVNEFICGGLTCLSTDFENMGRSAARIIISGNPEQIHNPFNLIIRNSI